MLNRFVEIRLWIGMRFHGLNKTLQPANSIELLAVFDLCCFESLLQKTDRLVVCLQRHFEWMAILSAVSKREPSRISKPARRSVNHFSHKSQRLKSPGAQVLQQQQLGEIVKVLFV